MLAQRNAHADPDAFREHLDRCTGGELMTTFANLGGDATLVVPCASGEKDADKYGHLGVFSRQAPASQQDEVWKEVGRVLSDYRQRASPRPVWLSTSGLGVPWLHFRFDSRPKYYTHEPYTKVRAP
jgi:hypothetical protein